MRRNKIIEALENEQTRELPPFAPGDTVTVQVRVREGARERLQAFEGVVIGKRNRGLNSSFTVRKMSHGVGVERTFQTHSPLIASLNVKRRGDVRKAKLYYLRERTGRAARIRESSSLPSFAAPAKLGRVIGRLGLGQGALSEGNGSCGASPGWQVSRTLSQAKFDLGDGRTAWVGQEALPEGNGSCGASPERVGTATASGSSAGAGHS